MGFTPTPIIPEDETIAPHVAVTEENITGRDKETYCTHCNKLQHVHPKPGELLERNHCMARGKEASVLFTQIVRNLRYAAYTVDDDDDSQRDVNDKSGSIKRDIYNEVADLIERALQSR